MALPATTLGGRLARPDLFKELAELRKEMDVMFTPFERLVRPFRGIDREAWMPTVDMFEEGEELIVRADLPGVEPKDVKVMLEKDILTIQGERRHDKKIEEENYFSREAMYGKFVRRIALQPGLKPEDMKASFKNGVLEVRLPRIKEPAPKEIPIQS